MRYFVVFFIVVLAVSATSAHAVPENPAQDTMQQFPESIKIGEKAKFSLKMSNPTNYRISEIRPIIEIMPNDVSKFVQIEINPQISTIWDGFYEITYGTILVQKGIPVDRIFVSISFVGQNPFGEQVPLKTVSSNSASIKIEKESGQPDKSIFDHDVKPTSSQVDFPLKQFRIGIPSNEIQCDKGLGLILRSPGGFPACVTPETKQKLIDRGLAIGPRVEEGSIIDTRYPLPTIIFPQNATGHAPSSLHPLPYTTIVWLGTNSTVSLINESVNRIELIIDKDNSTRQEILARAHTTVQFAKTGFYEYVIRATDSFPKSGDVVVLGENLNSLDMDERLKMAKAMVNKHLWGVSIIGFAEISQDGLLEITIHETEAEKIPNAKDHYLRLADKIIPFDVPISVVVDDIVMVPSK